TTGDASVLGFTPWERKDAMKRQFSLLMGQKNALWWDLPAQESLELNRVIYGIDRKAFEKIVGQLSDLLDVGSKMSVMVRELSLGERMKMELIAALLHRPKVLFLDEPTIGLDVTSQKKVREFLRTYSQENRIVTMLTSHYMQDIEELCERVILINHGKLFFDGPLDTVIDRFAATKIVSIDFSTPVKDGHFERYGTVTEQSDFLLRVEVPRTRVAEVCRAILGEHPVRDLSVEEVPIEEVIRRLFSEQEK
ncbi:MAG: ATP-binding cassette domain-containing protein, partial [Chthoniobacterales bacterium]